jgi:hypothetical protein
MKNYSKENTVLLYLKDKIQSQVVKNVTSALKLKTYLVSQETDIAAVPYFFAIIESSYLHQNFFSGDYKECIQLEDPKLFGMVLVGKHRIKIPAALKRHVITTDLLTEDWLKGVMLQKLKYASSKKRQSGLQQKQIHRIAYILREIMNDNYLFINQLCEYFDVSEKTIRRDFNVLNQIGENIAYDARKKAYRNEFSLNEWSKNNEEV